MDLALVELKRRMAWPLSRPWGIAFLSFCAGAIATMALPSSSFFPVLFVSFPVLMTLVMAAKSRRQAFWRGWWAGFGFFLVGLSWVGESFSQQARVAVELAPVAVVLLTALLALYWGFMALAFHAVRPQGSSRYALTTHLVFAGVFTLFEGARAILFTGFPWNLMGFVWSDWIWVAQLSRWIGIYGLSFLTVALALSPLALWQVARPLPAIQKATAVLLPLFFLGASIHGWLSLRADPTVFHDHIPVVLVQANVKQKDKWNRALIDDHFAKHIQLSRQALRRLPDGATPLLIWPEVAVQTWDFDRDGSLRRYQISRILEGKGYAVTGARRYERRDGDVKFYNSLFAISPSGGVLAAYDKNHLLPFGEYLPLYPLMSALGVTQLGVGEGLDSGDAREAIDLVSIPPFLPLICYEIAFSGAMEPTKKDPAAEWLLTITNDAWFGLSAGPYQHFAHARMRAIEEGLPVVRVAGAGISAVIDGRGRIIKSLGLGRQGVLVNDLPKMPKARPFLATSTRNIAFFSLLCVGLAFLIFPPLKIRARYTA